MSRSVGVIGLRALDVDKFPKHTFGATISFYEGHLARLDEIDAFCRGVDDVFALTDQLSTSTRFALPKRNLFMIPGSTVGALVERLEKKYGILERADVEEEVEESVELAPLVYTKPSVSAPRAMADDPYYIPLDWRTSLATGSMVQMRYPVEEERVRTIDFHFGIKSDYSYIMDCRPGDIVCYKHSANESVAAVETRATYVLNTYPAKLGFEMEAHIHKDRTYYLITTIRRSVHRTRHNLTHYRAHPTMRASMDEWGRIVEMTESAGPDPLHMAVLQTAAHDSEVETTVLAVDESVEVPDYPMDDEPIMDTVVTTAVEEWPSNWTLGLSYHHAVCYRPGIDKAPEPLEVVRNQRSFKTLKTAKPGDCFQYHFDMDREPSKADYLVTMRYPITQYSHVCGYVIEAHCFGRQIVLYVTDVPFSKKHHRSAVTFETHPGPATVKAEVGFHWDKTKAPVSLNGPLSKEMTTSQADTKPGHAPPHPATVPNRPQGATVVDVDFWKQIYALAFQKNGDNAQALLAANQAAADLNTYI